MATASCSRVGDFELRNPAHAGVFGLGLALWAVLITRSLARLEKPGVTPGS